MHRKISTRAPCFCTSPPLLVVALAISRSTCAGPGTAAADANRGADAYAAAHVHARPSAPGTPTPEPSPTPTSTPTRDAVRDAVTDCAPTALPVERRRPPPVLGYLVIPKLNVDAKILPVPIINGDWDVKRIVMEVGWLAGTAPVGAPWQHGHRRPRQPEVLRRRALPLAGEAGPRRRADPADRQANLHATTSPRHGWWTPPRSASWRPTDDPQLTLVTCNDWDYQQGRVRQAPGRHRQVGGAAGYLTPSLLPHPPAPPARRQDRPSPDSPRRGVRSKRGSARPYLLPAPG